MISEPRTYPLKRPEGHVPPVPRWQLVFEEGATHVHVVYLGVQQHDDSETTVQAAEQASKTIQGWIDSESRSDGPSYEDFNFISGNDAASAHVWVGYWADEQAYKLHLENHPPESLYASLPESSRATIGIWRETFSIPVTRLETNYTGLDYLPGFAQLPGAGTEPHTLTAYWGAARDRIAASADDLFPKDESAPPNYLDAASQPGGLGQRLTGTNANNIVHIRTGQFWENCPEQESAAYERKLEPTLEAGLRYLRDNPSTTGAMGLRYLRNTSTVVKGNQPASRDEKRKETCVTGYFTSLDKLEGWAKSHKSHLAIYNGAMRHAKEFGAERQFRTWHEVAVLKQGEARFEYINCVEGTGLMPHIVLERRPASVAAAKGV